MNLRHRELSSEQAEEPVCQQADRHCHGDATKLFPGPVPNVPRTYVLPGRRRGVRRMLESMIEEIESAALVKGEPELVTQRVREALAHWLAQGLPAEHTRPADGCYARHVIHCDPLSRFCIVSIVLMPGQSTPIHNHNTWGVIGVVTGREREVRFRRSDSGQLEELETRFNAPGDTAVVIPPRDVHRIEGASADGKPTVSIHVYGGNVDRVTRSIFDHEGVTYVGPCATSYPT